MYYFPIKINGRRIHYCELANENEDQQTVFNFLVQKTPNTALLLFKWDSWLISEAGSKHNVQIENLAFALERKQSEDSDGFFEYELSAKKGRMRSKKVASDDGALILSDTDYGDVCLGVDSGKFKGNDLKLTIVFQDEGSDYSCTMTFNLYKNPDDVVCAALDFGSEASQIRMGTAANNLQLVDKMCDVANANPKYPDRYKEKVYWQGKIDDQYFKSIFWVNFKPALTQLAEMPMANGPESFIQMLNTYNTDETKDLYPLPNIKLLELAPQIAYTRTINFTDGTSRGVRAVNPQLSDRIQQDNIVHLLITSFLHSLLFSIQSNNKESSLYLQFIVLAPNVYSQEKVYGIVEKLYRDFEIIKESYPSIKGIEVQTLSESDASFLGFMSKKRSAFKTTDDYYLIIDAGKGTTDFSVIKRTANQTKFDSLYRCGIPASGNVLTHSFYEALREIKLKDEELSIDKILEDTHDYCILLNLQEALDKLKFKYESPKGCDFAKLVKVDLDEKESLNDIGEINDFLGLVAEEKKIIPNLDYHVVGPKSNVEVLKDLLKNALEVIKSQGISFDKVILTGRGFCFKPFADRVAEMLKEEQLIDSLDSVLRITNADMSKSICMDGTLQSFADKGVEINHKSLLVGSPVISYTKKILFKSKEVKKPVPLAEDFYFKGYPFTSSNGFEFQLNGRAIKVGEHNTGEEYQLFFVGRTFLEQGENETNKLTFQYCPIDMDNTVDYDVIIDLVHKSLFPFNHNHN